MTELVLNDDKRDTACVNLAAILQFMTDKHFGNSVFRILDAAINRAGEGIRVVEDYARMVLGDAHLSRQLKQLRHDLTQSVASIDPLQRIAARDTAGDVGTTIQTRTEYDRGIPDADASDHPCFDPKQKPSGGIIQANFGRAQQAIRTIEEFSKSLNAETARQVEQIRYRSYTLEKAILTTVFSLQNLVDANLYVLIDAGGDLETRVGQLIQSEVSLIQLRDKALNDRQLVETGRALARWTRGTKTKFIMNDRADLAVAVNADGVHLGQEDLTVSDARRIVGATKMIGVSAHSIGQARQAVLDGANYLGVGPVFSSTTKQFDTHVGLDLVREVAAEIRLPVFAIGGISLKNVDGIVESGLSRVAVGAAVANAENPAEAVAAFRSALKKT